MKKFQFSLNTVLSYKQQRLELLQNEHSVLLLHVQAAERRLFELQAQYGQEREEYAVKSSQGISITEARLWESKFRALEQDIQAAAKKLEEEKSIAEKKREEVVDAKKDTTSIEKLKEKKIAAYQKAAEKETEHLIDEFVSSVSASTANQ